MSARNARRWIGLIGIGVFGGQLALAPAPAGAFFGYKDTPSAVFGASGSGNGQFSSPVGVAADATSNDVYVVDQGNNRVQKFDAEGKYLSQLTDAETPAGSLSTPREVAVDNSPGPAKGDVYVTDDGHGVIDVFGSNGKYLSQIKGTPSTFTGELYGVAVDASGNVWVYESNGNVDEFSDTGGFVGQFNTERGTERGFAVDSDSNIYLLFGSKAAGKYTPTGTKLAEWGAAAAIAVDATTNNVFLDTSNGIEEFGAFAEPYGSQVGAFGSGSISSSDGIAVDGATHTVYVSQSEADTVEIFKSILLPDATTGSASEVKQTSAKLEGIVNPDGEEVTSCQFEYGASTAYGHTAACTPAPGSGSSPVAVSANVNLEPNTLYHFRLIAGNASGFTHGSDETLKTQALAPVIGQSFSVSAITRVTAVVSTSIDPEKSATIFHIVYGETSHYGQHTIDFEAGADFGGQEFRVGLQGLVPGEIYHYSVVAINQAGTVTGPDETFTTAAATPPAAVTGGESNVTLTTATVSGTIDPEGLETSYELDLGTDTTYGTAIYGEAGSASAPIEISVPLQNLAPGTTYHYRIVAINSDGKTYGADQAFATPAYSAPIVLPSALPLLQTPSIAFPTETGTTVTTRTLTNAQKLANALKLCKKKARKRRASCERQARKRYPSEKKRK